MCNREIASRRVDCFFPRSSTTIRGRSPGGSYQPLHWRRWRNTENGRGLTRAPLGFWIFHHLMGGVWTPPPPSISAPAHRITKRKTAFESSQKIISKSYLSFFGSGQNWGHQGSKFQNFPKRVVDDTIFNFKGRATILIPSCLPRQGASNHV